MAAPTFNAADFLKAIKNLLPTGRAWNTDPEALQDTIEGALSPTYARLQTADNLLIAESLPSSTTQLLPEWEETLGLPDPCAGGAPSTNHRRQAVVARFSNSGGQSVDFFTQYADNLGYTITITYGLDTLRFGDTFGEAFGGDGAIFYWTVNTPGPGPIKDLECEFNRLKPAHTIVLFNYT